LGVPGGGGDVAVKQEPIKVGPKIGRNDPALVDQRRNINTATVV